MFGEFSIYLEITLHSLKLMTRIHSNWLFHFLRKPSSKLSIISYLVSEYLVVWAGGESFLVYYCSKMSNMAHYITVVHSWSFKKLKLAYTSFLNYHVKPQSKQLK